MKKTHGELNPRVDPSHAMERTAIKGRCRQKSALDARKLQLSSGRRLKLSVAHDLPSSGASSSCNLPRICSSRHLQHTLRRRPPTIPGHILSIRNRRNLQSRILFCSLRRNRGRNHRPSLRSLCNHHHRNRGHNHSLHRIRLWLAEFRA
jgi:hypothetical protein